MLRKRHFYLFIGIIILTTLLVLQFYFLYNIHNKNKLHLFDSKLIHAANVVKDYLPDNFHYKDMDEASYSEEEILDLSQTLNTLAKKLKVDYLYTMHMGNDNKIYYTSTSLLDDNTYYWYPLANTKDDSKELSYDFFSNPRIIYLDSSDKWGKYRSIYMPHKSEDGTIYLAGADILFENIREINFKKRLYLFFNFIILLFISLPLFLAFKNINKNEEKYKKKIYDLSIYDELTKAYNRKYGLDILSEHIELYNNYGIPFSIFMVDIANLDNINKSLGLDLGDELLKILVSLLKVSFDNKGKIIRIGEDDFIVLIPSHYLNTEKVYRRKLLEKITFFNEKNKKNYKLNINLIFLKYNGQGLEHFLEIAKKNIEFANKNGSLFIVSMQEHLEQGLNSMEFQVYFQPKINILSKKISFEALLRWNRKKGNQVGPDVFIPIAEKGILIFKLTNFVIQEVMEIIEIKGYEVSINLSPIIFQNESFFRGLYEKLKNFPYKQNIKFEIIETSAFTNIEDTVKKINLFKEIGIAFSLDDFGTGYSSLSYLSILPINEVKVDKSFVKKIGEKPENKIIIESIIKLSKILNFEVVIEGVENIESINSLIDLGCDTFQGYYFDKALSIQECDIKIKNNYYNKLVNEIIKNRL